MDDPRARRMLMRHEGWSTEDAQLNESPGVTAPNQELGGAELRPEQAMKEAGKSEALSRDFNLSEVPWKHSKFQEFIFEGIEKADPPRRFSIPKLRIYDGISDLAYHVQLYQHSMALWVGNEPLLCKVFLLSLRDLALKRFSCLKPRSISRF